MKLLSAVGSFASGKTTLVLNTLRALNEAGIGKESLAYVLNDEGTVDGSLAEKIAQVTPMVNGCFTCSDTAQLKVQLLSLENAGVELVFLEGFGIVSGDETKEFLDDCGYEFGIIGVLDHLHLDRNKVRYLDVLKTQIRAATLGVGITKYPCTLERLDDPRIEDTVSFVAETAPGANIFLVPEGAALSPEWLMAYCRETKATCSCGHHHNEHHDHGHATHHHGYHNEHNHHNCCGHDHNDNNERHHHSHSFYAYSFPLNDEVGFEDVRRVFRNSQKHGVIRIKGAIDGALFNAVHDEWRQTEFDQRRFVTFYAEQEISLERDLPGLMEIVFREKDDGLKLLSYQMLRGGEASCEATLQEIETLVAEFPESPVSYPLASGKIHVVTHPEQVQLAKEMVRRPGIEEHFPRVVEKCVEYWVMTALYVSQHAKEIDPEEITVNLRELGVSLSWWTDRFGRHFSSGLVDAVLGLSPGEMVAEGINGLKSLNSDPERAYWQCEEYIRAAQFGITNGEDKEKIIAALRHAQSLANTDELKAQWEASMKKIV